MNIWVSRESKRAPVVVGVVDGAPVAKRGRRPEAGGRRSTHEEGALGIVKCTVLEGLINPRPKT